MKWLFSLLLLMVMTFVTIDTFESDVANDSELVMNDFDIGIMNTNSNFQFLVFDSDIGFEKTELKSTTLKNFRQISNPFRKARDGFLCS
jgi:hypothetical protein